MHFYSDDMFFIFMVSDSFELGMICNNNQLFRPQHWLWLPNTCPLDPCLLFYTKVVAFQECDFIEILNRVQNSRCVQNYPLRSN